MVICVECGKAPADGDWVRHIRRHLRYQAFECGLCGIRFFTEADAAAHFSRAGSKHSGLAPVIVEMADLALETQVQDLLQRSAAPPLNWTPAKTPSFWPDQKPSAAHSPTKLDWTPAKNPPSSFWSDQDRIQQSEAPKWPEHPVKSVSYDRSYSPPASYDYERPSLDTGYSENYYPHSPQKEEAPVDWQPTIQRKERFASPINRYEPSTKQPGKIVHAPNAIKPATVIKKPMKQIAPVTVKQNPKKPILTNANHIPSPKVVPHKSKAQSGQIEVAGVGRGRNSVCRECGHSLKPGSSYRSIQSHVLQIHMKKAGFTCNLCPFTSQSVYKANAVTHFRNAHKDAQFAITDHRDEIMPEIKRLVNQYFAR